VTAAGASRRSSRDDPSRASTVVLRACDKVGSVVLRTRRPRRRAASPDRLLRRPCQGQEQGRGTARGPTGAHQGAPRLTSFGSRSRNAPGAASTLYIGVLAGEPGCVSAGSTRGAYASHARQVNASAARQRRAAPFRHPPLPMPSAWHGGPPLWHGGPGSPRFSGLHPQIA
jgi:hypothetical protein